ncbi:hypothetical protein Leryth_018360 [Lithospermum erythrorhizon]|nr:hypothetical protein Leryth_018360 [Lithospermum erythrorhizon]
MAATSTTTAILAYATSQNSLTISPKPNHFYYCTTSVSCSRLFVTKRQINKRPLIPTINVSSSSDASTSETTTTAEAESSEEAAAIELPEEPPSLISALNVDRALRGLAITEVDHYGILNLPRGCSYDQVTDAYTKKVEELKLMSQDLEDEELTKQYDQLKESYSVLSSVEERRLYDWSLARVGNPDKFVWPYEVDITQTICDPADPPSQEPEDIGPTRVTGYIILGWLMLSFVLLVALNT